MAGEIQVSLASGKTIYARIYNAVGLIWNTVTLAFETFDNTNYSQYVVSLSEQGASGFYAGTFPPQITPGIYSVVAKQAIGGSGNESQTDPDMGNGNIDWGSGSVFPLSNVATSGQVARFLPTQVPRGQMRRNYPLYFRSSADHVTPLVSGNVSGMISRDGGIVFGPLDSGAYTEVGNGYYWLQAFTSGDLNGDSVMCLFSAQRSGGPASDPLPISFITQRSG